MLSQLMGGFGAYALVTLSYILLSDFCSDKFRPKAMVAINSAWGLSTFLLGLFYELKLDWLYYLLFCVMVPLITVSIIFYTFIVESPYILSSQGHKEKALEQLWKIAKFNNRQDRLDDI